VREITGTGTQYGLDTTGVPAVLRAAVEALRPTGTLVVVRAVMGDIAFSSSGFLDGKTVKGVIEGDAYQAEFVSKMIEWHRRGWFRSRNW
jgi:aryl-alcohol dehydrogenase